MAFRSIAANTHPDHNTISASRKRCFGALEDLFAQILMMARSMGLLKPGTVSLDGTKVQANASRHKALSREYANRLEAQLQAEVEQLMAMAEAADAEVAAEVDRPAELKRRDDRLAVIRAAKAEMEARAAVRHEDEEEDPGGKDGAACGPGGADRPQERRQAAFAAGTWSDGSGEPDDA